jgi:hypothetical protein
MSTVNSTSYYINWRKGSVDDPYLLISEPIVPVNKIAVLSEVPNEYNHVSIDGLVETRSTTINSGQFYVDYIRGVIFFHDDQDGQSFTAIYYGKGLISVFADRVLSRDGGGNIVESLQDVVDDANASLVGVNTATTNANNAASLANSAASAANSAKTNADTATTNAINATTNAQAVADNTLHRGTYNPATSYVKNNIVDYNGSSYMNIVACTGVVPTDISKWKLIGMGLIWNGAWSASTTYNLNSIVQYQNSSYISLISNNLNNTPDVSPASWSVLAQKGTTITPIVTDALTVQYSSDNTKGCKMQYNSVTNAIEFVIM